MRDSRRAELAAARAGLVEQRYEIEALRARLARALRVAFGRSSEKLRERIEQLELTLADIDELLAETVPQAGTAPPAKASPEEVARPARRPLSETLPRDVVAHAAPCGRPPDQRLRMRQEHTAPPMADLRLTGSDTAAPTRARRHRGRHPLRARTLAGADAGPARRPRCLDNSAAERAIRPVTQGRRNWTFAGSDAGGERAAAIYSLLKTAKLDGVAPEDYLRRIIHRIADHPANRVAELLPWNLPDTRARLDQRRAA